MPQGRAPVANKKKKGCFCRREYGAQFPAGYPSSSAINKPRKTRSGGRLRRHPSRATRPEGVVYTHNVDDKHDNATPVGAVGAGAGWDSGVTEPSPATRARSRLQSGL